jgi:hypothetical protein
MWLPWLMLFKIGISVIALVFPTSRNRASETLLLSTAGD